MEPLLRKRMEITGLSQGMGIRPSVLRLARRLQLSGWVRNHGAGLEIEVQGSPAHLEGFEHELRTLAPQAWKTRCTSCEVHPSEVQFLILPSERGRGTEELHLPRDFGICVECFEELQDPSNRRFRYPMIHCTQCGPRYSVLESLPFDRERTSFRDFPLCQECEGEYQDPADRRFHAQAISCAKCGPVLTWRDSSGEVRGNEAALQAASRALGEGKILAVLGVGGFQLWVSPFSATSVQALRERKVRPTKPFALMALSLSELQKAARPSPEEQALLLSKEGPIVLLPEWDRSFFCKELVQGCPDLGVMLPPSALQWLLLLQSGLGWTVATSANRSGDPLAWTPEQAYRELEGIADGFLSHNRRIVRPLDDSIARVVGGAPQVLRIGRGYAPVCFAGGGSPTLALGAEKKRAIGVRTLNQRILSEHLGEGSSLSVEENWVRAVQSWKVFLSNLPEEGGKNHTKYGVAEFPLEGAAHQRAQELGIPHAHLKWVQHHHAHTYAVLIEHEVKPPAISIVWDGTGAAPDGSVWGGEAFLVEKGEALQHILSLKPFPLLGGEAAILEPGRLLVGIQLQEKTTFSSISRYVNPDAFAKLENLHQSPLKTPMTSSMGRLFDAVSVLLDSAPLRVTFEGEAALLLEGLARRGKRVNLPELQVSSARWDWMPLLREMELRKQSGEAPEDLACGFHWALATSLRAWAETQGVKQVLLSGGCFQNRLLMEACLSELRKANLQVFWPRRIPPHDGAIALGQLFGGDESCV